MKHSSNLLKDQVVVVTGGAGLLGNEFIKAIVENNGIGIIGDLNEDAGKIIKSKLESELHTKSIDFYQLDITSKTSINNFIHYLSSKYGKIDALVNSAYPRNKNYGRHFFDVEYNDFCNNINMNLGGCFLTSQLFALFFKKQGYGNIINIASIYGIISPRFEVYESTTMTMPVEYSVIKSGLIHLTKYMSKYLKGTKIRVNSISPGGILDNQPAEFVDKYKKFCLNKGMLEETDLKGTLVYLLSNMSQYVNGQNIVVDDGFTL